MKKLLPLVFVLFALNVQSQSLKDLLFSGKMKTDSGSVVRKGDDLKDKVDTTTKKPAPVAEKPKVVLVVKEKDSTAVDLSVPPPPPPPPPASGSLKPEEAAPASPQAIANRDNSRIWKEFVDTVLGSIKAEVLSSKKIKKGDYSITIDYTINVDGSVTIGNIFVSPESSTIQEQLKERLGIDTPKLSPMVNTTGTARKVNKRYSTVLSKQ